MRQREHLGVQVLVGRSSQQGTSALLETADDDLLELAGETSLTALLELTGLGQVGSMCEHRVPQVADALVARGNGRHDRRPPVGQRGEIEHLLEVTPGLGHSGPIGFVDDEHVSDLEQTGLVGLHRVAPTRVHDHDRRVGFARDLDLDLADTDCLDEHPWLADRIEQPDGLGSRERKASQMAAGCHRPDEDARIGRVVLHAHAVPEDRTAREGGRRVDGEHRDVGLRGAEQRDELAREGRLARSRARR